MGAAPLLTSDRSDACAAPSVLVVLREARMGGAERVALETLARLDGDPPTELTALRTGDQARLGGVPLADPRLALAGPHTVLHTHLFLPGLIARLRRMWDPAFRWVHTLHYHPEQGSAFSRIRGRLDRWILPEADTVIAVSPTVLDSIRDLPQALWIPNAIEIGALPSATPGPIPASAPGPDLPVVGTVAMLRREKGLDDLIRAVARLKERGTDVRLRIAGDGPLRAALEGCARDARVADRVEFTGYLEDLVPFYRSLTVYVQPSVSEPYGLAALEALRFGRPVVGTDAGHLPELLGHGRFGLLASRSGDAPEALADRITMALAAPEMWGRAAEEGRRHWAARLDPDRSARAVGEVYRAVLLPRVCFLAPIASHGGGGLQRQVQIQSRALAARSHRVLLVQRRDSRLAVDPGHRAAWKHVEIHAAGAGPDVRRSPLDPNGSLGRLGSLSERIRGAAFTVGALVRLVTLRRRYDLIHAQQLYSPTLAGAIAKRILGKRLVVRVTASGALGERNALAHLPFARLRRWAFRQVDRVVVLSEAMRREMLELGFEAERILLLPNAVELPPAFEPPSAAVPDTSIARPFRLLYTGRLSSEKSLETAIEAVRIVASEGLPIELRLVGGDGGTRDVTDELRRRSHDLPGAARISFDGPFDELGSVYRWADAFVLPSISEGMSNALLEAMAHGLCPLVSDIPENRAVVEDGVSGLFFPRGDARALAALLRDRISEGGAASATLVRLGLGARTRIEQAFGAPAIAQRLSALYEELLSPPEESRLPRS